MKKYPSTEQFRNIVKKVRDNHDYQGKDDEGNPIYGHLSDYPKLTFKGTVKLHGTNAAVVKYKDGRVEYQSRERVLSIQNDNAGFMMNMLNKDLDFLFDDIEFEDYIAVYGEWCGGNIQKGVAINGLDKMFVIFAIDTDGKWSDFDKSDNSQLIYNINDFDTYLIDIDFEYPELSQNELIRMTLEVEEECPVGKYFGNSGIGEGIVFTCITIPELKFKSKGEKHSVSKVKVLNSVDVEQVAKVEEFVENVCTENRLEQGVSYLKEMGMEISQRSTGDFLRWVVNDIFKEEEDTIVKNQLDIKKINSIVANKAKVWYFNNLVNGK